MGQDRLKSSQEIGLITNGFITKALICQGLRMNGKPVCLWKKHTGGTIHGLSKWRISFVFCVPGNVNYRNTFCLDTCSLKLDYLFYP